MRLIEFIRASANDVDERQNTGFFGQVSPKVIDDAFRILNGRVLPGMSVLDIGCGNGYALDKFKALDCETTGITMNEQEAMDANARGHNVTVTDMHFMDFPDGSFDLVWARHSLEHSVVPYWVIRECYRMLKPGGTFYMETPAPSERGDHESNLCHFSIMPIRMWLVLLNRAGFESVETYDITFGEGCDKYHSLIARKGVLCQTSPQESMQ